jgi:hypothetical protein
MPNLDRADSLDFIGLFSCDAKGDGGFQPAEMADLNQNFRKEMLGGTIVEIQHTIVAAEKSLDKTGMRMSFMPILPWIFQGCVFAAV